MYTMDHIEGKFSNVGESFNSDELLLLFGGIYFVHVTSTFELTQISNAIKFPESVYHALEFARNRILVSLWEPGALILDRVSGQCIRQIHDPLHPNVNCRGFTLLPGYHAE